MKLIALGAFALASLTTGAAAAQTPAPAVTHGPVIAGICAYSPERMLAQSTAGQSLHAGMQRLQEEVRGELEPYAANIQTERQQLQQGGQAADPDGSRARAWQQRVAEARQLEESRTNELRYTELMQTQTIVNASRPIVVGQYQSRGCSVLLDADSLLAINPQMDLTDAVIQQLNTQLPSLPAFNRMPVPVQPQQ
jgi:outer membrane protein